MQQSGVQNIEDYQLICLEQHNVLMRRKNDRKVFQYYEQPIWDPHFAPAVHVQGVIQPIPLGQGFVYKKGITLKQQIQKYRKRLIFTEQELVNTLLSVLAIIKALHQQGYAHGCVSPSSILIDESGEIKLYYPAIASWAHPYYDSDRIRNKHDDYRALGLVWLCMLQGKQTAEPKAAINSLREQHRIGDRLALALRVLTEKNTKYFEQLDKILSNHGPFPAELQDLYGQEPRKRKIKTHSNLTANHPCFPGHITPPLIKHEEPSPPRKHIQITRKPLKIEDTENKEVFEGDQPRKTYEPVFKQKNNGRTLGQGQNNSNHPISSPAYKKILRDIRETKEREDLCKPRATIKQRMRTIPKKKIH